MQYLSPSGIHGDKVALAQTHPRHLGGRLDQPQTLTDGPETSFGKLFLGALGDVNASQHQALAMTQTLVTDPEEVDIHDVTVALTEANLALSITKAIMDGAVRAYREIISLR